MKKTRALLPRVPRVAVPCVAVVVTSMMGPASAAPPAGHFVLQDANQVVRDTKTNLRWERVATATLRTHALGVQYCAGLTLAGGGWRLPTIKELLTIVDRAEAGSPKWPTAFFDGPVGEYWSSTTAYMDAGERYYVSFVTGAAASSDQGSRYVRCVK